jgi:hypothetical protein
MAEPIPADLDEDYYDFDSEPWRSWCGGKWYLQECDDPIQCCDPRRVLASMLGVQWHGPAEASGDLLTSAA